MEIFLCIEVNKANEEMQLMNVRQNYQRHLYDGNNNMCSIPSNNIFTDTVICSDKTTGDRWYSMRADDFWRHE